MCWGGKLITVSATEWLRSAARRSNRHGGQMHGTLQLASFATVALVNGTGKTFSMRRDRQLPTDGAGKLTQVHRLELYPM